MSTRAAVIRRHTEKRRSALIFGHADGDGYLAAEQSRENLTKEGFKICEIVVDPRYTCNFRFWESAFQDWIFANIDLVIVVDIRLNISDPIRSYNAILSRVRSESNTDFEIIDHYPISGLPAEPSNLQLRFVDSVYQCCYGTPSDLMVVASICDKDEDPVASRITELHRKRALGVKRSAADHRGMAGRALQQLLSNRDWRIIEKISEEPSKYHRTFYGRRWTSLPQSAALYEARHRYC